MNSDRFDFSFSAATFLYVLRCLIGVVICYALYGYFPQYPFHWSLVSVVVAISPDSSNHLAYDRMKANLLGGAVGLCLYFMDFPALLLICAGVIVTIIIGTLIRLNNATRSAMAALIIVMIQEGHVKDWDLVLQRVACVFVGCVTALLITLLFNLIVKYFNVHGLWNTDNLGHQD
jgi:uncharacterized membrane protein YgaE (UPF0421/DUF939 family)